MHLKYLFALLIIFSGKARAQAPSIQWQKCYGGMYDEEPTEIILSNDGGYLIVGSTGSNDGDVTGNHGGTSSTVCGAYPCPDAWIIKIDTVGTLLWQKCVGGTSWDIFNAVIQKDNNNILCFGSAISNDGDVSGNHNPSISPDLWGVQIDSNQSVTWQKCYGGLNGDVAYNFCKTADSGYIICGATFSNDGDVIGFHSNSTSDIWVVKIDSSGNIQWQKCLGGSNIDEAFAVRQTLDGNYIVGGSTSSGDGDVIGIHNSQDMWLVKLDTIGNIIWQKCLGGSAYESMSSLLFTSDGGFIATGTTNSVSGDVTGWHVSSLYWADIWVVKMDSSGNIQWQHCYGGTDDEDYPSIAKTSDGGYVVSCSTKSTDGDVTGLHGMFPFDIWVFKIDSLGNLQWERTLGGSGSDLTLSGNLIKQTSDGGYIVSGITDSNDGDVSGNHGSQDIWVVKLAPDYSSVASLSSPITDFTTYLNPGTNQLTLTFYANGNERTQVQLLDITGRVLLQQPLSVTSGFNKQEVQAGQLAGGVYLARLVTEGGSVSKKLIVPTR